MATITELVWLTLTERDGPFVLARVNRSSQKIIILEIISGDMKIYKIGEEYNNLGFLHICKEDGFPIYQVE